MVKRRGATRYKNFKKRLTLAQRAQIKQLSIDGLSIHQIMSRCKVGYATVLRYSDAESTNARDGRIEYGDYAVVPKYSDFLMKKERKF